MRALGVAFDWLSAVSRRAPGLRSGLDGCWDGVDVPDAANRTLGSKDESRATSDSFSIIARQLREPGSTTCRHATARLKLIGGKPGGGLRLFVLWRQCLLEQFKGSH
eukprot:5166441-Prymnesium_polylepis.3